VFTEAKDDGGGGDNWTTGAMSWKVPVKSSITTNKPISTFLQAVCPSCRPTNSVKALKAIDAWSPIRELIQQSQFKLIVGDANWRYTHPDGSNTANVYKYQMALPDMWTQNLSIWSWYTGQQMRIVQIDQLRPGPPKPFSELLNWIIFTGQMLFHHQNNSVKLVIHQWRDHYQYARDI